MAKLQPSHGGTDSGPEPLHDFSTNANPLGPCPSVLTAIQSVNWTRYPDPTYARLREKLAAFHNVTPKRVVVGAGASELIMRLIRAHVGAISVLGPTFSEYARCAAVEGQGAIGAGSTQEFLYLQQTRRGLGFICWPNNPTGMKWPLEFVFEAAKHGKLVVDLAYAPLCPEGELALIETVAEKAYRLYAPNKAFGLCGVRAAYVITPRYCPLLSNLAPCWVLDQAGAAFLDAIIEPPALRWLAQSRPIIAEWRTSMARAISALGFATRESPATFLMARVGNATQVTQALRALNLRVRDCHSFGLPEWLRISAQPPEAQKALLTALPTVTSTPSIRAALV